MSSGEFGPRTVTYPHRPENILAVKGEGLARRLHLVRPVSPPAESKPEIPSAPAQERELIDWRQGPVWPGGPFRAEGIFEQAGSDGSRLVTQVVFSSEGLTETPLEQPSA